MKKLSLNRPSAIHHSTMLPFSRPMANSGGVAAPRPDTARPELQYGDGSQQDSQSKHPFLSRSSHPYSSQSQQSLPQGCVTQSQNTQRFSQNSQPEDSAYDQWRKAPHEKEMVSQQKPPPPYYAGFTSTLGRRDGAGSRGGPKAASLPSSSALCLLGPQNGTTRPWPQCSVSEDLEGRLGNMEKLRMEELSILHDLRDDYQNIKTLLEETCFESKDNRSKVSLQQNSLHKLLKEEETANRIIMNALKSLDETLREEMMKLKQKEEETINNKIVAGFNILTETFREELMKLTADVKAGLQAIKQLVPTFAQQQKSAYLLSSYRDEYSKRDPRTRPVQSDAAVTKQKFVDRLQDFDLNSGLTFLEPDDESLRLTGASNRIEKEPHVNSDDDLRRSVRRKMLRAQRKIRKAIY